MGSQPEALDGKRRGSERGSSVVVDVGRKPEALDDKRRGSERESSVVVDVGRKPEALDGKRRGFSPSLRKRPRITYSYGLKLGRDDAG
ncbi:MAG TPA: hypothetical protein PLF81_06870 [Candidatus Anammoximicrobium sp.]|nr:hypothetical protein [Candidatus Anammoximicrobium sp.]